MSDAPYPAEENFLVQELQDDGKWIPIYAMEDATAANNRFEVRAMAAPKKRWRIVRETRTYDVVRQT